MTSAQIRQSFLDFFKSKQHTIVSSSSLMPDAPNLLFTNAGMNQFVPIFLGQQKCPYNPPRAADTQKCIRAGGKHNDLEDVGLDTYHHTFFEMLGNWSFGDYFKKEAIEWAWDLLVERWKFPPERLYATVYQPGPNEPSEFDQEAYNHWARLFRQADLDPKVHVLSSGKADNFWMMGDTGPCGPCSEVHMDLTPDGDTRGALVNQGDPRCIEIWNLVFIQFNANPDGSFMPLPQRHVDTGMGFERVTAIMQGTRNLNDFSGTISNYDTDVFRPIFDEIEKLSGRKYTSTLPTVGQALRLPGDEDGSRSGRPTTDDEQEKIDVAFRVIADHIRALSFAIADGIIPSNEGRGYVLRRILRRAVRYGRTLGFHEPFFFKLVDIVATTMGDVFSELRTQQSNIKETIRREEEAFNKTLDRGIKLFENDVFEKAIAVAAHADGLLITASSQAWWGEKPEEHEMHNMRFFRGDQHIAEFSFDQLRAGAWRQVIKTTPIVSGEDAFKLYDTYGFPLDLTELMARERGLTIDIAGFEKLMEEQRARARAARKTETIRAEGTAFDALKQTEFVGYTDDFADAEIIATRHESAGDFVVVDRSPLYAEMGGQVGDKGVFRLPNQTASIVNTVSRNGVFF